MACLLLGSVEGTRVWPRLDLRVGVRLLRGSELNSCGRRATGVGLPSPVVSSLLVSDEREEDGSVEELIVEALLLVGLVEFTLEGVREGG